MPMLCLFFQNFKYSYQTFSVARFIVGCHFVTKCTCSDLHVPSSVTHPAWVQPMPAASTMHVIKIARPQVANVEEGDANSIL